MTKLSGISRTKSGSPKAQPVFHCGNGGRSGPARIQTRVATAVATARAAKARGRARGACGLLPGGVFCFPVLFAMIEGLAQLPSPSALAGDAIGLAGAIEFEEPFLGRG